MIASSEVGSSFSEYLKLGPGASNLDATPLHGSPDDFPGSSCRRVCLLLWWACVAEREMVGMFIVMNGPWLVCS